MTNRKVGDLISALTENLSTPNTTTYPNSQKRMSNNIPIKAVDALRDATQNGCRFMSFLYTTKGEGKTSRYTINFGIDYAEAVKADLEALKAYQPQNDLEAEAKLQMETSMTETLTQGVSSSYTQVDTFDHIGRGMHQHKETGEIYVWGFVHQTELVAPATNPKKPVNSRPLTLAKKAIKKSLDFKCERFGKFIINPSHIAGIKVNGDLIEIQNA